MIRYLKAQPRKTLGTELENQGMGCCDEDLNREVLRLDVHAEDKSLDEVNLFWTQDLRISSLRCY
jgi:hypothetical protein